MNVNFYLIFIYFNWFYFQFSILRLCNFFRFLAKRYNQIHSHKYEYTYSKMNYFELLKNNLNYNKNKVIIWKAFHNNILTLKISNKHVFFIWKYRNFICIFNWLFNLNICENFSYIFILLLTAFFYIYFNFKSFVVS